MPSPAHHDRATARRQCSSKVAELPARQHTLEIQSGAFCEGRAFAAIVSFIRIALRGVSLSRRTLETTFWRGRYVGSRALRAFYRPVVPCDDGPFGVACMPAGVSPCGLDAGAPPDVVLMGPVGPWGCG